MEIRRWIVRAVMIVGTVGSTGCATMVHGRSQDVRVFSTPSGATLFVNGVPAGTTPTSIRIRRAAIVDLRLEKPGHADTTLRIPRSVSGWVTANGIVLNPYGAQGMNSTGHWARSAVAWFAALLATDRLSGAMFVRPKFVEATLPPLEPEADSTGAPELQGSRRRPVEEDTRAGSAGGSRRR